MVSSEDSGSLLKMETIGFVDWIECRAKSTMTIESLACATR